MLHPACVAQLGDGAEYIELDRKIMDAYFHLLAGVWSEGRAFVVVEQDIEIRPGVLHELAVCDQPWCLFPYSGPGDAIIDQALGCTRFSEEILAAVPDALSSVHDYSDGLPPRDWRRVDTLLTWKLRMAGYTPHVHLPAVIHHHVY